MTSKKTNKKYKVIAIHYGNLCNKNPRCKMCYVKDKGCGKEKVKSMNWFCNLVPHLKTLTEQVALGSYGEPLLYPSFIKKFSSACKKNELICNMTTNGIAIMKTNKNVFDNLDMVSISFNNELMKTSKDVKTFRRNVSYLKRFTKVKIGCNLLINNEMFNNPNTIPTSSTSSIANSFKEIVDYLFSVGVNNVYALYPKNYGLGLDITRHKAIYLYLTMKYDGKNGKGLFVVDDLTKEILEQGYKNWKNPCHFARDMVSISPNGEVYGCSFDQKSILKLNKPKDILKISKIKTKLRYECPYLKIK